MAEITRVREYDPLGRVGYRVEWRDYDGIGRERYFTSFGAAETFALEIEAELLKEAIWDVTVIPSPL